MPTSLAELEGVEMLRSLQFGQTHRGRPLQRRQESSQMQRLHVVGVSWWPGSAAAGTRRPTKWGQPAPVHVLPPREEPGGARNHKGTVQTTPASNRQRREASRGRVRNVRPQSNSGERAELRLGPQRPGHKDHCNREFVYEIRRNLPRAVASFAPRAKCKLLCCMCHRDETVEENKRDTLLTQSKKMKN